VESEGGGENENELLEAESVPHGWPFLILACIGPLAGWAPVV
jgi:hypothetical protein